MDLKHLPTGLTKVRAEVLSCSGMEGNEKKQIANLLLFCFYNLANLKTCGNALPA